MVKVVSIESSMLEQIQGLLSKLNAKLSREEWNKILDYKWENEGNYKGLALVDGEKVVGYLGCLFSERMIDGQRVKICSTTSWIVEEAYRAHSLAMLMPVLKLKDYTLTNLSPSKETYTVCVKLGFRPLEDRIVFLPYLPTLKALLPNSSCKFISQPDEIKAVLTPEDLKIYTDHQVYSNCQHHVIRSGKDYCYLMTRIPTKGRWFWFTQIYYISNQDLFWDVIEQVKGYFLKVNKTWMTMLEGRFVDAHKAGKIRYELPCPRLYRSQQLSPKQIDILYSEQVLLNR